MEWWANYGYDTYYGGYDSRYQGGNWEGYGWCSGEGEGEALDLTLGNKDNWVKRQEENRGMDIDVGAAEHDADNTIASGAHHDHGYAGNY